MAKLNQIIAAENGEKKRCEERTKQIHHRLQKSELLSGLSRRYTPKNDEDTDRLPDQTTRVQTRVSEALRDCREAWTRYFDVTATKDWANCTATADVTVDGQVILQGVPVVYLLFLEKQLRDEVKHLLGHLPTLDPAEEWHWDAGQNCWASTPKETARNKKLPRVLVRYEATKEHPAQTEVWHEDVPVGVWQQILYSGAATRQDVQAMIDRAEKLIQAVQYAREQANMAEAPEQKVGGAVFDYLFGKG